MLSSNVPGVNTCEAYLRAFSPIVAGFFACVCSILILLVQMVRGEMRAARVGSEGTVPVSLNQPLAGGVCVFRLGRAR